MRGLVGKTFLVAGGATGIGAGAALRLVEEGANVVIGDINQVGVEATATHVALAATAGSTAIGVHFDLSDNDSVVALVETALNRFGALHGLLNVGADLSPGNLGRDKTLLDTDFDVWHRTLDVNLVGYVRMCKATIPHLLDAGGGSVVNTSSGAAVSAGSDGKRPAYAASKSAVNAFTRHVAKNYGPKGVRCNAVMPGLVMGELQAVQNDTAMQQMFLAQVPTTRLGRPSDLGAVIAFLLSDDAEWINGQVWAIDGGANMRA